MFSPLPLVADFADLPILPAAMPHVPLLPPIAMQRRIALGNIISHHAVPFFGEELLLLLLPCLFSVTFSDWFHNTGLERSVARI